MLLPELTLISPPTTPSYFPQTDTKSSKTTPISTTIHCGGRKRRKKSSASLVTKQVLNTYKESLEENDEGDNDHEDEENTNDKVDDDRGDYYNYMPALQDTSEQISVQETHAYNFVFPNEMLGLELTEGGRNGVLVSKVNIEELKNSIHIKDTIIAVSNERVGNDLSALRFSKQPLCIQFSIIILTIHRIEE